MARIKKRDIFEVVEFPLVTDDGKCTWPAKYPTQEALDIQRKKVTETAWLREYLLKVVPDEGAVVRAEQIHKYNWAEFNKGVNEQKIRIVKAGAGQDLAIGEKATNDCTAIVSGLMVKENGIEKLKIRPKPINERADFDKTITLSQGVMRTLPIGSRLYVEDVAYQKAAIQTLRKKNLPVTGVKPIADKRARFETAATYIINGQVEFPTEGCEDLIMQMLGFGAEEHDDLVDALVYLILEMFNKGRGFVILDKVDRI
jgi:predicted phage terminase large subunit-like protein